MFELCELLELSKFELWKSFRIFGFDSLRCNAKENKTVGSEFSQQHSVIQSTTFYDITEHLKIYIRM